MKLILHSLQELQYDEDSAAPSMEAMAQWFAGKWGVPLAAYVESMEECRKASGPVPQWYVVTDAEAEEPEKIVAGAGVIANDFHKRPELTPNLCALYVEEPYRRREIARTLLDFICDDLSAMGVERAYLITGHTDFYEKCGWDFYGMIEEEDGNLIRMYTRKTEEFI
ncbi:MAG: GNAT family N-acetyltransferase [Anaerovoracaceae bacterium]|nr:GNAT family N-acetyltransferase [Anaerovoracaceae bacterium]